MSNFIKILYPLFIGQSLVTIMDFIVKCNAPKSKLTFIHWGLLVLLALLVWTTAFQILFLNDAIHYLDVLSAEQAAIKFLEIFQDQTYLTVWKVYGLTLLGFYFYIVFSFRILPFLSKLLIIFSHILSRLIPFIAL